MPPLHRVAAVDPAQIYARFSRVPEHIARKDGTIRKSALRYLLRKHLIILLTKPELSSFFDMVIICRDVKFRCHKAIVCAQSKTIRDCCIQASVRAHSCTIKLRCHPLVFRMALEYLYTCDYKFFLNWDFPTRFQAEGQTVPVDCEDRLDSIELSLHLQVYILAKCLRIPALKYLSAVKISEVLQRSSFPTVFPRFVREVYKLFPRENMLIKRVVLDHMVKVMLGIRSRNHFEGRFPWYIFDECEGFLHAVASRGYLDGRWRIEKTQDTVNMRLDEKLRHC
ncbi:hypothetical protein BJX61DRAFT_540646 [Aspergillus egyptiacus]|nr:hypothetical protein BJX61DRAFT_540646 [Aspergillus egyptiacus]